MYACMYVCMHICMYACMQCMYVCMYGWMDVFMYLCMYVFMWHVYSHHIQATCVGTLGRDQCHRTSLRNVTRQLCSGIKSRVAHPDISPGDSYGYSDCHGYGYNSIYSYYESVLLRGSAEMLKSWQHCAYVWCLWGYKCLCLSV